MTDSVEVAIESALLNRLVAFCASPAIPLALPNINFTPPAVGSNVFWLKADFLPADSFSPSIGYDADLQHYGLMQVSVFYGQGSGELAPARLAARVIELFPRGQQLIKDGFVVAMWRHPFRGSMIKDDPWVMIPVSVPYISFAPHPA
ncbi:MAG TPA: DUF4128 domain-containing protein [Polyangia bacterium]|nr:DUF4128 domain-containing protein [Polyangia bacterium]